MNIFKTITVILAVVLCAGCAPDKKSDVSSITVEHPVARVPTEYSGLPLASQWILENFNDKDFQNQPISKSSYININANLKEYTGNGGCNALNGAMLVKDDHIKFDRPIMTKMACGDLQQESLFVENLNRTTKYKIQGGELFLYEDDNLLMTLENFKK